MRASHPHFAALVLGALVGLTVAACGPIRYDGPTAIILKVLLNEGRGSHILYISGVDRTPINVFPSVYRPETVSPTQLPTGETMRILLDDSLAGTPITLTVVGLDESGVPVESGSAELTLAGRVENPVTVKLTLYDADAGVGGGAGGGGGTGVGGGIATGGGGGSTGGTDGGIDAGACKCATGCCDKTGQCVDAGGAKVVVAGSPFEFCLGFCDPLRADRYTDAGCGCGTKGQCANGTRCQSGSCVCDEFSGCTGCCTSGGCSPKTSQPANACGAGGFKCDSCLVSCVLGVCTAGCLPENGKCCSGNNSHEVHFPTCATFDNGCVACDPTRSNVCTTATVLSPNSCGCGTGAICNANQICVGSGAAAKCLGPFPIIK